MKQPKLLETLFWPPQFLKQLIPNLAQSQYIEPYHCVKVSENVVTPFTQPDVQSLFLTFISGLNIKYII